MRIFVFTETLLAGGAEWFALRFAEALSVQHEVKLFVVRPDLIDTRLTDHFHNLPIHHLPATQIKTAVFIDRIINKVTGRPFLLKYLNSRYFKKNIQQHKPDVLHSHLLNTDIIVAEANKGIGTQHISTIHGDYIQAVKENSRRICQTIAETIEQLDSIAAISDEQTDILCSSFPSIKAKLSKIYNGYPVPTTIPVKTESTFNFGMIARGIPEKGWEPAIKAFTQLQGDDLRLYLYGESEYLDTLRKVYPDKRIVFAGFSNDPARVIANFDVGLLPSYYNAESLPTTIIEYLALDKPVITTSIGEIPKMLSTATGEPAGIVISELHPEKMADHLVVAMNTMMLQEDLYNKMKANCVGAFAKFSMDKCVSSYMNLYKGKTEKKCVA